MIILPVDIGNTHIEVGLYDGDEYITSWRIATGVNRTEDEMLTFVDYFLSQKNFKLSNVHDMVVSSVVPNVTPIFRELGKKYLHSEPLIVDDRIRTGLKLDYHPPSAIGADRICNAVAVFDKYGGPAIVVDFGTATTLDVVDAEGVYLGGAIAPGVEMTASSLYEKASKLAKISLEFPETVVGKTTEHSMQAGIMFGTISMVDGLIERMKKEIKGNVKVIATGGLAGHVIHRSRGIQHVEPNLVLEGLMKIYFLNRPA